MLSAVVVDRNEQQPGQGFFRLAIELGLLEANDDTDLGRLRFFAQELKRVHKHWLPARSTGRKPGT